MDMGQAQSALKDMIVEQGEESVIGSPAEESGYDSEEPSQEQESNDFIYEFDVNGSKKRFQLLDELGEGEEISELGFKLHQDYQKEMQELKAEREKFSEEAKALMEYKTELRQQIDYEYQLLQSEEMQQLKEDGDPDYYRAKEAIEKKVAAYKELAEAQSKAEAGEFHEKLQNEQKRYKEIIPEWVDSAKQSEDLDKIEKNLLNSGISSDVLPNLFKSGLYNAGVLKMLRDGILYAEMKAEQVKPQFAAGRQGVRGQAGVQRKDGPSVARQKLHQTGKLGDAQAAIRELLGE